MKQKALNGRDRRRHDGDLVRVEVRVPAIDAALLHDLATILRGKSAAAEAMRNQLRSIVTKPRAASVFDIFGSDLPDAYFDGVAAHNRQGDMSRDIEL